jgi:hypothetical protein
VNAQAFDERLGMRNLLPICVLLLNGCCLIHPCSKRPWDGSYRAGEGLGPTGEGVTLSASARLEGERLTVSVDIENTADAELLVKPDRFNVFDSPGNQVNRELSSQPFRCRGRDAEAHVLLGLRSHCRLEGNFAVPLSSDLLGRIRIVLNGIQRQGRTLPVEFTLDEVRLD